MSQQGNYYGSSEIQQQLAVLKDAVKGNAKAEKAFALAENIVGIAGLFTEHVKLRFPKKKRIFRKRDRNTKKFKKQEDAKKLFLNSMQIQMSLMQHEMIKAQPIPKFQSGMKRQTEGQAYVNTTGAEIIITP